MGESKRLKLRASVRWFAEEMEERLLANDHKGGWLEETDIRRNNSMMAFCDRAKGCIEQSRSVAYALRYPCDGEQADPAMITQEAADAANYMMMVADMSRCHKRSNR